MFAKYFEYYIIILRGPFFRGHAVQLFIYFLFIYLLTYLLTYTRLWDNFI